MFQKFGKNSFNGNFFWFTAEGLTVFHHDHSDRVVEISHCSEEDCFKHNLTYTSNDRVIMEVMSRSRACYQLFQVNK